MESRKWLNLLPNSVSNNQFTILSFNLLAQVLIQKQQFPHCDSSMLRWKHRSKRVLTELRLTDPDIILAQEVDSYEDYYKKQFDQLGYHSIYNKGTDKKHGCCIAFKKEKFELVSKDLISFDSFPIGRNTYSTNNILQLVKIKFIGSELGLILTNNHLFWHPNYDYERTRQFSIMTEATKNFSKNCDFPIINGGDFNTTPCSLGYLAITRLLKDDENQNKLYKEIKDDLKKEIEDLGEKIEKCKEDLNALIASNELGTEEGSESNETKKRKIGEYSKDSNGLNDLNDLSAGEVSKRNAIKKLEDEIEAKELNKSQLENPGLLPIEEIVNIIQSNESCQSAYADYTKLDPSYLEPRYGHEPIYTNITPWFKGTLDYLFYRNTHKQQIEVDSIFSLPDRETLGEGLPNNQYGSDHLSIAAKFNFKQLVKK